MVGCPPKRQRLCASNYSDSILCNLDNGKFVPPLCDAIVEVQGRNFLVQRAVLAAASPYFNSLYRDLGHPNYCTVTTSLYRPWCPSQPKTAFGDRHVTTLPHINPETFEAVLNYIYSGTIDLDMDNVRDVIKASDILLMQHLKDLASEYLLDSVTTARAISILQWSQHFHAPTVTHRLFEYICDNFREVSFVEEFYQLPVDELLLILCRCCAPEEELLDSIARWVRYKRCSRIHHLPFLMGECAKLCNLIQACDLQVLAGQEPPCPKGAATMCNVDDHSMRERRKDVNDSIQVKLRERRENKRLLSKTYDHFDKNCLAVVIDE